MLSGITGFQSLLRFPLYLLLILRPSPLDPHLFSVAVNLVIDLYVTQVRLCTKTRFPSAVTYNVHPSTRTTLIGKN